MLKNPSLRPRENGLAGALFTRTQQRVLGLLFGYPSRSFYTSEIISRARVGSGAVQRELKRLEIAGLVMVSRIGSQKHYQADPHSPLFKELTSLVRKTVGLADPLREALAPLVSRIVCAFVYGSVASRKDTAQSDVDLMIVSDELTYADLFAALERSSIYMGRRVNPTVYSSKEFDKRLKSGNAFLVRVLKLPKLWLIGSDHHIAA